MIFTISETIGDSLWSSPKPWALREKCPNKELFLVRIFLYSVQTQENTEQKKLRIWTLFRQCGKIKLIAIFPTFMMNANII